MIEIAPNLFVKSWEDVVRGYVHGCGHFIVDFADGRCVHVSDPHEIQRTIATWRTIADAPLEPKSQKVPSDIVRWMGKPRAGVFR